MIPSGYGRYAQAAVAVEKKEDILLLLLETVSMDLKKVRMGIEERNPRVKGEAILRTISILTELDCSLDHEADKNLTENLSRLYRFMVEQLTVANMKNDLNALEAAERVLDDLYDGFKQAAQTHKENHRPASSAAAGNDGGTMPETPRKLSVAV